MRVGKKTRKYSEEMQIARRQSAIDIRKLRIAVGFQEDTIMRRTVNK